MEVARKILTIMKVFKGVSMIDQYAVETDRTDPYSRKYKLGIECKEFGHGDRENGCKVMCQKHIENRLNCTFMCYNPDAKDFKKCNILNETFQFIHLRE